MQVSSTSPFTGNAATNASSDAAGSNNASSFQSLLDQLTDYENETPAQRMEASILAQLGITPQQLQSMSPQDREKVETEVTELMKKEMQAQEQQQQQLQQAQIQQQVQAVQAQMQLPTSQSNTPSSSRHDTTINL
jgi:predicted ATP-binding protein involved in virulence